jgi:hypothetical protein
MIGRGNGLKIILRVCETLCGITLVFIFLYSTYLETNRPNHPVGIFSVKYPVHGDFVFISSWENFVWIAAWCGFFLLVVLSIILENLNKSD